jgi:hypothetical protein
LLKLQGVRLEGHENFIKMHKLLCFVIGFASVMAVLQAMFFAIGWDRSIFNVPEWSKVICVIAESFRKISDLAMFSILAYILNRFSKGSRKNLRNLVDGGQAPLLNEL